MNIWLFEIKKKKQSTKPKTTLLAEPLKGRFSCPGLYGLKAAVNSSLTDLQYSGETWSLW